MFLSHLATAGNVAASTQNQALAALVFLYRQVLEIDLPRIEDVVRARRGRKLPVVFTRDEAAAVLAQITGTQGLVASLLYGAGLRLLEALRTWISPRGRFWCATGKDRRIASLSCRSVFRRRCRSSFAERRSSINGISRRDTARYTCRTPWQGSTPT